MPEPTHCFLCTNIPIDRNAISQYRAELEHVVACHAVPHWQNDVRAIDELTSEDRIELLSCPTTIGDEVGADYEDALARFSQTSLDGFSQAITYSERELVKPHGAHQRRKANCYRSGNLVLVS